MIANWFLEQMEISFLKKVLKETIADSADQFLIKTKNRFNYCSKLFSLNLIESLQYVTSDVEEFQSRKMFRIFV